MKASNELWKDLLAGKIAEDLAGEIDTFETEVNLRSQDKLDESFGTTNALGSNFVHLLGRLGGLDGLGLLVEGCHPCWVFHAGLVLIEHV